MARYNYYAYETKLWAGNFRAVHLNPKPLLPIWAGVWTLGSEA